MRWNPSLSVGDVRIDEQHQHLFHLLDAMEAKSEASEAVVEAAIAELRSYVTQHLRDEESVLRSIAYKDYQSHCAHHKEFEATLEYLVGRLATESHAAILDEIKAFVADWLVNHIVAVDQKYKPFLMS